MNRKSFVKNLTALGAIPFVGLPNRPQKSLPKFKMGLQLFSVRDAMAQNPKHTLQQLAQMGYQDFETYGFDPNTHRIYGLPVGDFKLLLDDLGLSTTSGHYGFSDYFDVPTEKLQWFVDQCIFGAQQMKAPYITWPWVHPSRRNAEGFKQLAEKLSRIGEQINQAGLGFAYHNHGYEFENWEGTTGHEILMANTDPALVKLQMDMYWVIHSGKTPKDLVTQQAGRYVMWHIKDMDKITRDYSELGQGSIDYSQVLPDPQQSGLEYYYIEQGGNFAVNAMVSAATSAAYFKKHLQQLL